MRHSFYWLSFFGSLFLVVGCATPEKKTQPNILWILAEDLSPDLACYGNPLVETPNLDSLAQEGVRFESVFTTAGVCTPSRTALATGMYQTSINAYHMRYPDSLKNELPEGVLPLNEIFRRNGYQTINLKSGVGTGKTDWSFKSDFSNYDFNSWDQIKPGKPFFGVVNMRLTHRPFEKDTANPISQEQVKLPPYYPDHEVARQDWADYLESLQILDKQVGEILAELKRNGYAENTIIYFFSDHGRPFTRGKTFLYDSGIEIPLIIKCPGGLEYFNYLPKGTTKDQLISAIDITATSLSMAGIKIPEYMQGRVFIGKEQEAPRTYVYSAADRIGEIYFKSRSVRSEEFKYIKNYHHELSVNEASTAYRKAMHPIYQLIDQMAERDQLDTIQRQLVLPVPEEELYNIRSDPFEVVNLADDPDYRQELIEIRDQLAEWQQKTTDYGLLEDDPRLAEAFNAYGEASAERYRDKTGKLRMRIANELSQTKINKYFKHLKSDQIDSVNLVP